MIRLVPVLGLLLTPSPGALAQPPAIPPAVVTEAAAAKVPALPAQPVKAKVGELVTFEVRGEAVGYQAAFDAADCLFVRLYSDDPKVLTFLAQPKRAGAFGVVFWEKGEIRGVTLPITTGEPPAPPKPPEPAPPPPPAPNPYRASLKAAYDLDTGANKDAIRLKLVELYRLGADVAVDPDVITTDVLRERLRRAASALAADQLVGLRTAISLLIAPALPLGQPMTAESRVRAAELFRLIADALEW